MSSALLQIQHAQCQRAGELLFAPVSFEASAGQMVIIKGANGSGKTTLMEAIAGLSVLTFGHKKFNHSEELNHWLNCSHYLGHKLGNKSHLTCGENLAFVAAINQVSVSQQNIDDALEQAGLVGYAHQNASDMSAGQKKRLALTRLLLLNKTFWLLDEPFVNLDHEGCEWLYQIIANHVDYEGVVIITAHDQKKIHDLAHQHISLTAIDPAETLYCEPTS